MGLFITLFFIDITLEFQIMKATHITALSAALATAMMSFSPATMAAEDDLQEFTVQATVPDTCYFPAAQADVAGTNSEYISDYNSTANAGGGTFDLDDVIDDNDATLKTAGSTVAATFAGSYCNYASQISVQSANGGMTHDGLVTVEGTSGTFADVINYTAAANFCGDTATITTTAATTAAAVPDTTRDTSTTCTGAWLGDVTLTVSAVDTTVPLVTGAYTDTLRLQLGAAL